MSDIRPDQVHAMCAYLEPDGTACIKCAAVVLTPYGEGTRGCYAIAEETLQKAREILATQEQQPR